jgi:hypothetical protein
MVLARAFFMFLFSATPLFAGGGIVAAGGDINLDRNNPWFISTPTSPPQPVKYCIARHPDFSSPMKNITQSIGWALNYWYRQFAQVNRGSAFTVAAEKFVRTSNCDDPTVDLRLLFGVPPSDPKELEYIYPREDHIGITVRTHYEDLRGKGFIYFSPDTGPNKFKITPSHLKPWSGSALEAALIHELGHVFGLPHVEMDENLRSKADPLNKMSSNYLYHLLMSGGDLETDDDPISTFAMTPFFGATPKDLVTEYCENMDPYENPRCVRGEGLEFHYALNSEYCLDMTPMQKRGLEEFYGKPVSECFREELDPKLNTLEVFTKKRTDSKDDERKLGLLELLPLPSSKANLDYGVKLYVSAESADSRFKCAPKMVGCTFVGPSMFVYRYDAQITSKARRGTFPASIQVFPPFLGFFPYSISGGTEDHVIQNFHGP